MTELQQKVYDAIQSAQTDEDKVDATLNAVAAWYYQKGAFHDGYEIQSQLMPPTYKPYTIVPEPTLRERAIVAARKFFTEHQIDDDAKIKVDEEGVWLDCKVFMYHYQVEDWSTPGYSFDGR